jgi:hypothetical protein
MRGGRNAQFLKRESVDAKVRGLEILARAKNTAMENAAREAWNAHYFKCTPQVPLETWTMVWKKAVMWWTV